MNIGYNKTTKKLIGYSTPKNGVSVVVEAYAVDDLLKKFKKEIDKIEAKKETAKKRDEAIEYIASTDERETELMIKSTKGLIQ